MSYHDPAEWLKGGIARCLRERFGWEAERADQAAEAAVDHLQSEYGGDRIYIPARSKAARNAAIRREFNGRNLPDICVRYGLSPARVYQIVNQPETSRGNP